METFEIILLFSSNMEINSPHKEIASVLNNNTVIYSTQKEANLSKGLFHISDLQCLHENKFQYKQYCKDISNNRNVFMLTSKQFKNNIRQHTEYDTFSN